MPYLHEDEQAQQYFDKMKRGICPICDAPMEQRATKGGTAYAVPCGHVLYYFQALGRPIEEGRKEQQG